MALLGLWPETQGSSGVGTGILGSFWDFIKVVNFPFYFQEGTWDFLGNTAVKKGFISHGGENSRVFVER